MNTRIFETSESDVRSYCRTFPAVFSRAKGAYLYDETGREFIDFFAGAGALNYGHNPEPIKHRILQYLQGDGVTHALDMYTDAKRAFLEAFVVQVLCRRGLDHKVQCVGPTGANAVEAALKIARRVTDLDLTLPFLYSQISAGAADGLSRRRPPRGRSSL